MQCENVLYNVLNNISFSAVMYTPTMNGQADPTSILKSYTHRFLQLLCVSASVHCENMAPKSLHIISKHLTTLLLSPSDSSQLRTGVDSSESVETALSEDSQRGVPQAVIDSAHTRPADSEQVMCNFFILFFHYYVWIVFLGLKPEIDPGLTKSIS